MKHSKLLFLTLFIGAILTISGYCVPNLQYHKWDHNAGHPSSNTSTKPITKPLNTQTNPDTMKNETVSDNVDESIPTVKQDLKNPTNIEDGSAEEFP